MYSADCGSNFCCGVKEIGSFDDGDCEGATPEEFLRNIFRDSNFGKPNARHDTSFLYHIWFVRHADYQGSFDGAKYGYNDLRLYIQSLPGVIALGEHINPNTGNMIDGYFFKEPE